jgi:hypothetical protein
MKAIIKRLGELLGENGLLTGEDVSSRSRSFIESKEPVLMMPDKPESVLCHQ